MTLPDSHEEPSLIPKELEELYQQRTSNSNDKNIEKQFFNETIKFLATNNHCIWCNFPSLSMELLKFLYLLPPKFSKWFKVQSQKCLSCCINCIILYYTERSNYLKTGNNSSNSTNLNFERVVEKIKSFDNERLTETMNEYLSKIADGCSNPDESHVLYMLYEILMFPRHVLDNELASLLNETFKSLISRKKMIKLSKILPGLFYLVMHENQMIRNWSVEILSQNLPKDIFIKFSFSITDLPKLPLFDIDFKEFYNNLSLCLKFITEEFITEDEVCDLISIIEKKGNYSTPLACQIMHKNFKLLNEINQIKKLSDETWIRIIKNLIETKTDIFSLILLSDNFQFLKPIIGNLKDDLIIQQLLTQGLDEIILEAEKEERKNNVRENENIKLKSLLSFLIVCHADNFNIITLLLKSLAMIKPTLGYIDHLSDALSIVLKNGFHDNMKLLSSKHFLKLIKDIKIDNFEHLDHVKMFNALSELIKKLEFEDLFNVTMMHIFNFFSKLSMDQTLTKSEIDDKMMQRILIFEYMSCIEDSNADKISWKLKVKISENPCSFLSILHEHVEKMSLILLSLSPSSSLPLNELKLSKEQEEEEEKEKEKHVQFENYWNRLLKFLIQLWSSFQELELEKLTVLNFDKVKTLTFNIVTIALNVISFDLSLSKEKRIFRQSHSNNDKIIKGLAVFFCDLLSKDKIIVNSMIQNRSAHEKNFKCLRGLFRFSHFFPYNSIRIHYMEMVLTLAIGLNAELDIPKNYFENFKLERDPGLGKLKVCLEDYNEKFNTRFSLDQVKSLQDSTTRDSGDISIREAIIPLVRPRNPNIIISSKNDYNSGGGGSGSSGSLSKISQLKDELSKERSAAMTHIHEYAHVNVKNSIKRIKSGGNGKESNSSEDDEAERDATGILLSLQKLHDKDKNKQVIPANVTTAAITNTATNDATGRSVKLVDMSSKQIISDNDNKLFVSRKQAPSSSSLPLTEVEIIKNLHLFILSLDSDLEKVSNTDNSSSSIVLSSLLMPQRNLNDIVIPNSFQSASHYISIFEPLFQLECRSRIYRSLVESSSSSVKVSGTLGAEWSSFPPIKVIVKSLLHVDNFHEIVLTYGEGGSGGGVDGNSNNSSNNNSNTSSGGNSFIPPGRFIVEHDILQIIDSSEKGFVIGVVTNILSGKNLEFFDITCRMRLKPSFLESLRIGATWKIFKFANIITDLREYLALYSIGQIKLSSQILSPRYIQPSQELTDQRMRKTRVLSEMFHLNASQALAVATALADPNEIILIQGPPGTGKTKTIEAIVSAWISHLFLPYGDQVIKSCKLLICSPSNAAIDEIARRLKYGIVVFKGTRRPIKIVRIGSQDMIHEDIRDLSLDAIMETLIVGSSNRNSDYIEAQRKLIEKLDTELKKISITRENLRSQRQKQKVEEETKIEIELASKMKQIKNSIWQIRENIRKNTRSFEDERQRVKSKIIKDAQVICCTLSGSGLDVLSGSEFDAIIVDEACQSIELSCLIPLQHKSSKCILVGDPNQLPPTIISKAANHIMYEQSLFQRLQKCNPERVILLQTQYRMHPEISMFPSEYFYQSLLNDGPNMKMINQRPWHKFKFLGPYQFINVMMGREEKEFRGYSLMNRKEVIVAINIICHLCKSMKDYNFADKIGIIAPYKQQKRLFQQEIAKHLGKRALQAIEISTVDGFQGQEREIIIFSCVRTGGNDETISEGNYDGDNNPSNSSNNNNNNSNNNNPNSMGFLDDARRLNVALTRAKCSLIILGKADFLKSNPIWRALIQNAKERNLLYHHRNEDNIPFFPPEIFGNLDPFKAGNSGNNNNSSNSNGNSGNSNIASKTQSTDLKNDKPIFNINTVIKNPIERQMEQKRNHHAMNFINASRTEGANTANTAVAITNINTIGNINSNNNNIKKSNSGGNSPIVNSGNVSGTIHPINNGTKSSVNSPFATPLKNNSNNNNNNNNNLSITKKVATSNILEKTFEKLDKMK